MNKLDIINGALDLNNSNTVETPTGNTREHQIIERHYDRAKKRLISREKWLVALTNKTLAPSSLLPNGTYVYELPNDCVQLISSDYEATRNDSTLQSASATLEINYIKNIDETVFSPEMGECFIYTLAIAIASPLTGDKKKRRELQEEFEELILPNAIEEIDYKVKESDDSDYNYYYYYN